MARKASNRDETSNAVPDLDLVVREIADEMRKRPDRGEVATYIPELARVNPKCFGLVVIDAEVTVAAGGESNRSRSKASRRCLR
jgi:glutaminase